MSLIPRTFLQNASRHVRSSRGVRVQRIRALGTKSSDDKDWDEWIPPNRPLAGDKGRSDLYPLYESDDGDEEKELKHIEEQLRIMEEQEAKERESLAAAADEDLSVDWLQTRRQVLQENEALDMLPPDQAKSQRDRMSDIPVKKHTLLSKDEIASCLQAMGGRDIKVIIDLERRMGGILGIILVTAVTRSQIRVLADALVRQMRRRQLEEVNVVGAQLGPEGNTQDDGWWAVDCRNFVVHIQDEETRWAVDLEGLWSGNDDLHSVDPLDEEQVDDYVAQNPVPASFGRPSFELSDTLKQLEKSRWTQSSRPVVPKRKTGKKRRKN